MKRRYEIKGMTCAACQAHVEKATKLVNGVIDCKVNLLNNNMDVELADDYVEGSIEKAISDAGYSAYYDNNNENKIEDKINDNRSKLRRVIVSFVLLIILMYVSMGNMLFHFPLPNVFDMHHNKMGFVLIQFIITIPILYINKDYLIRGFKSIIKWNLNMDTLIFIGVFLSVLYGIFAMFMISYGYYLGNDLGNSYINTYHNNIYFESAAMILCFVSLGKYLEDISKERTKKSIKSLINLAPKTACVRRNDKEIIIEAKDVVKDDIVILRQGDIVPVDGIVISGVGSINESNITGEPIPNLKSKNDILYSSTIVENGYLEFKATKVGEDSSINMIIKLVEEASNSKAPISKIADKVSKVFVPIIIILSLLTFIINLIIANNLNYDNSFSIALNFAITVVVIACPCALGLATPVAIMVSTGIGATNGIIIKNAAILENTSKIDKIIFDKTGTLTIGKPIVNDFINYADYDILDIIYEIEKKSSHPLAKAIIEYTNERNTNYEFESITMIEGMGLIAKLNNDEYYLGNIKYIKDKLDLKDINIIEEKEKLGNTVIVLYMNKLLGILSLKDELKDNAKELIEELNSLNIDTIMLTGDNENSANQIAKELSITKVIANVLPSEKGNVVKEVKEKSDGLIAMVGDGVNDAIALANSDIAISLKGASDIAIESADIVLLHNDLYDILNVIKLSKRTLKTIELCLFWAFFYNFICVILATGFLFYINGFKMNPMYGSIAMSISSISVVLTALSINLFKFKKRKIKNEIIINVKGMMCENCEKHVVDAVKKSNNILSVTANHKNGTVNIIKNGDIDLDEIKENIKKEGYKVK